MVQQSHLARQAFLDFGKGRHAAGLNFDDYFAYALAKFTGERLLSRGRISKRPTSYLLSKGKSDDTPLRGTNPTDARKRMKPVWAIDRRGVFGSDNPRSPICSTGQPTVRVVIG